MPVTISRGGQVPSGGWWGRDGIMFALGGTGIVRVSPEDGTLTTLIPVDNAVGRADSPQMLPGGRTVLYTLLDEGAFYDNRWDSARIVVQSLDGGAAEDAHRRRERREVRADRAHRLCAPGYVARRPVRSRDAQRHRRSRARHRRRAALGRRGEWGGTVCVLGHRLDGLRARTDIRAGGGLHLRPSGRRHGTAAATRFVSIPARIPGRLAGRLRLERWQGVVRLNLQPVRHGCCRRESPSGATTATRSGPTTASTWRFNRTGRGLLPCSGRRSAAAAPSA